MSANTLDDRKNMGYRTSLTKTSNSAGQAPRICYIDASLRNNIGHYANSCRHIAGEFRRRNFAVDIYANRDLAPALARELGASPFCRHAVYDTITAYTCLNTLQPLDHWLARVSFLSDLRSIWRRGPYGLVFINSVLPAQLAAVAWWLDSFPLGAAPRVAVEFGAPTGDGFRDSWWRQFPKFYRDARTVLNRCSGPPPFLFTFDPSASAEYTALLGHPVATMPAVHAGKGEPRPRIPKTASRITVAFIGHQRTEKGYHLIPAIVRELRSRGVRITVLVHNGDPEEVMVSSKLRTMAAADPQLQFEQKAADSTYWQELLSRSDMIVLPYDPTRYRASYSAVAVEAVGEGIPMVVPGGTTMHALVNTYQGGGMTFAGWDVKPIADAIEAAAANFGDMARHAAAGAIEWRRTNGAAHFVDRLLEEMHVDREAIAVQPERYALKSTATGLMFDALFTAAMCSGKWLKIIGTVHGQIKRRRGDFDVTTTRIV